MRFDICTLFPAMCRTVVDESIVGRAQQKGAVEIFVHDIREYTENKHRRVDDYPYGGGVGMVMQAPPIYACIEAVRGMAPEPLHVIYLSPKGKKFDQKRAVELSALPRVALLCGHYEGVDERALELCVDEELSVGDFVLTGGELPALCVADAVCRLLPGVLKSEECYTGESIHSGLLEYPQYSRPPEFMGLEVPEILLSGHHVNVEKWRRERSLELTRQRRPDLLETAELTASDRAFLTRLNQRISAGEEGE